MRRSDHPIRCRCGHLRGLLDARAPAIRINCHCRDCQAYAHALGKPQDVLDAHGGTHIVSSLQQHLRFTEGQDALACLSLREAGLLRWYASCCGTPIANTARDPKMSYLGLVHTCLGASPAELDADFGADRVQVSTEHAKGRVKSSTLALVVGISRIFGPILRARINGSWKRSPFFRSEDGQPVVPRRVLEPAELERAQSAI